MKIVFDRLEGLYGLQKDKDGDLLQTLIAPLRYLEKKIVGFLDSSSSHPQWFQNKQSSQTPNHSNTKVASPPTPNITPLPSKFKHKNKINSSKTNERKNSDLGGGTPSNNNIGGRGPP
jgi:hypothetical protein